MNVVIIDYNAGNVQSVKFALERHGISPIITDDHDKIKNADKVIFPGVGEAASTMIYLQNKNLDKLIVNLKQPVLGICLGMQLMCSFSEERKTDCLGIFSQKVYKFTPPPTIEENKIKIPHTGWNNIYNLKGKLFEGCDENSYVYFVHSYYVETGEYTIATSNYIHHFTAALNIDNFYATQFHPEKSGIVGHKILGNFLALKQ